MLNTLNTILLGCGLAVMLSLFGFLLVRFGFVTRKTSKRSAVLTASLAAAIALWLLDHSSLALGRPILDKVILFFVLWFSCFFIYWLGVAQGLKTNAHRHGHEHDFGDSSILSMQYLETRMHDGEGGHPNFQETEILVVNPSAPVGTESSAPSPNGKNVIHIPVKRQNG